jgi:two-component system OmpR family response regulator
MHILVAEDDQRLARLLDRGLSDEGHIVRVAHDGEEALAFALDGEFDVLVLDVMMPVLDGFAVLRALREQRIDTPVLFLTARGEVADRVEGLDAGGDDYLVKPFAFDELLARIRALGRRTVHATESRLSAGAIEIDLLRHEAFRGEHPVDLAPTEFRLLEHFMRHPGRTLSRRSILAHVWGYDADSTANVVDLYVHYLRRKLGDDLPLSTVRGIGYRLDVL